MNDRIQEIKQDCEHLGLVLKDNPSKKVMAANVWASVSYLLSEVERLQGLVERAKDTVESLYQLTHRGELSSFDITEAEGVYDTFLSHLKG